MVKLLRMGSVSSLVAMAAVCIGVLFVMPLVAAGVTCPVATCSEPCIKTCPECCVIVRNTCQTCNGAVCTCAQAQTIGAPLQNSACCLGASCPNPSGYVCQ